MTTTDEPSLRHVRDELLTAVEHTASPAEVPVALARSVAHALEFVELLMEQEGQ
jgi:hypothetical protein